MNFGWTEEQTALRDKMVALGETLNGGLEQNDRDLAFPKEHWQALADEGVFGLCVPQEYGGQGYDTLTAVYGLEGLGYGCVDNGLTMGVNGQVWAVQEPIVNFGTEEQKRKYLPRMMDGSLKGVHGMTEADSGSDAFLLQTAAVETAGGYRLNGGKVFITFGPVADLILVFATTNPDVGRWGVTAFLVEADSPGVVLHPPQQKMGLRTNPMGSIDFNDVFVPVENRLGNVGSGASIFGSSVRYERAFIFTSHVGSMARQLDQTIAYAQMREMRGEPISKFQAVSHRIVDMKVRLETARSFLYKAAWCLDQGENGMLEATMAKLALSELFVENSIDAMRTFGGRGYLAEYGIERDVRDALGGVIYAGTSDIQRNVIATLLGL